MAHPTVADQLVETLAQAGVERIYGIVGDSLNPVTDAIRRSGKLAWVRVRHEETAAFAAGAEAQLTGRLAACAGSCGPGNLHLINGLYDAHRSMAPVLAIASHIPSSEIGTGYFQETHPDQLFRECSHYCELVSNVRQMPRVLQIALQHAIGRRGVSVIVLPGDVAAAAMPSAARSHGLVTARPVVRPADRDLDELAALLNSARTVTLFGGSGCADAHDEVLALADMLKAPVGYAYRGKPWLQYDNPYEVGMSGLIGFGAAYRAMHECDVLLLLGTDFPYEAFMPAHATIAQVDIRPEHLGRRSRLDLGVCGDVRETLRALLPRLDAKPDRAHLDAMLALHAEMRRKLRVYVDHVGRRRPIHPELVAATLSDLADDDAVFTVDTGMCNVWEARYIRATRHRRFLASHSHGSMANALPQAIGAQCAYPRRQVISVSGDGGFTMLMGDFLSLVQHDLPVKVVVFNNSALGMIKLEMRTAGLPDWQTDNKNPDFARMAEAIGVLGVRIEDPAEVRGGLQKALAHPGPALVDVVTDPNALSIPSHFTLAQAEGFALAMAKMSLSGHIDEVVATIEGNWRNL
jgi:pyruvate dehydrogenase (quinone)